MNVDAESNIDAVALRQSAADAENPVAGAGASPASDAAAKEADEAIVVPVSSPVPTAELGTKVAYIETGASGIQTIEVSTGGGDIIIQAHDQSGIAVYAFDHDAAVSQLELSVKENLVKVVAKARKTPRRLMVWRHRSQTTVKVLLPAGIFLNAKTDTGHIRITGARHGFELKTNSGDIHLTDAAGVLSARTASGHISGAIDTDNVHLLTGSGHVSLTGLTGSLNYKTTTGALRAVWAQSPSLGTIEIKAGKGSVALTLPKETRMNSRFITGPTPIMNQFENDANSGFSLGVTMRSGSLEIRKAE